MRTFNHAAIVHSYHKYLASYGKVDVGIFTWKNKGYSNRHGHANTHEKHSDVINQEDLRDHYGQFPFFNIETIVVEDFDAFHARLSNNLKTLYNKRFRDHAQVSTSIPIQYKYQQACSWLTASTNFHHYTNVMVVRPDMEIVGHLPIVHPTADVVYFKCPCNRCMDHCWFGAPSTIVKQLRNIFDEYETNTFRIAPWNDNNRDNNEMLILQCLLNGIRISTMEGLFARQHFF